MRAGRTHEGLTTLTGFPCIQVDIDPDSGENVDMLWAQLCSGLESGYLIGASCGAGRRPVNDQEYRGLGLMSQHAYSVLEASTINNERLIRLRNPWSGNYVWSGLYGFESLRSNLPLQRRLYPEGGSQGTFWMPFSSCKLSSIVNILVEYR